MLQMLSFDFVSMCSSVVTAKNFVLGVGAMAEVPIIVSHVKNHLQRTSDQTNQDVS